ncbi:hypothetical protein AB0M29_38990 [Streptomyces sp. NPDC051976]|uniref:hypothetical protein n=1 Tax=Streptomyces sp. NPDC051976 TaxID=3154947 RepID=UPI00341E2443
MNKKLSPAALTIATVVIGTLGLASVPAAATRPGRAAAVHVAAHFDLASGQTPENGVLEPDGSLDVTFSVARQVARVDPDGGTHILATMPLPADGGANTPILHFAPTMGIVRADDGTLYFLYATGTADLTGVWRLRPRQTPERIAALPADGLPNGMALDRRTGKLYIADSVLGTVWTVPVTGGTPTAWTSAPELAYSAIAGANGLKIHNNALWVSDTDDGTILRIPLLPGNRPGQLQVRATGLTSVDDFTFTGRGDEILAALNHPNTIVRIRPDGHRTTVLNAADGLQNPTSIEVRGTTVYVLNAAYVTAEDPNVLVAGLRDLR